MIDLMIGTDFRLAVADPGGGIEYHGTGYDFAGAPLRDHPPVELCAFAACTAGAFYGCRTRREWFTVGGCRDVNDDISAVLLLVARMPQCLSLLEDYHRRGKTVAVTFTEQGTMQIALALAKPKLVRQFHEICRRADGALGVTPEAVSMLEGAGARNVELIPNPIPIDDPAWDFSVPVEQRRGILVGTTYFHANERNHVAALLSLRELARTTGEPISVVIDQSTRYDRRMGKRLRRWWPDEGTLRIIDGPIPFLRFLRLMATHRVVFQLDQAAGCGQVGAEALLCRIPCVGGYGGHERVIFPELCGYGRGTEELVAITARLLADPQYYEAEVARGLALAEPISFAASRVRLAEYFAKIRCA